MPRPKAAKTMKDSLRGKLGMWVKGYRCSRPRSVQMRVSQNKVPSLLCVQLEEYIFWWRGRNTNRENR